MRVGVIGSRNPSIESLQRLNSFLDQLTDIDAIISGGAYGADTFAMKYAVANTKPLLVFRPRGYHNREVCDWCKNFSFCNIISTGLDFMGRNTLIVENSDIIVCPDYGNGTIDTMEKALAKNIVVYSLGKYIPGKYNKSTPNGVYFI